ncbi:MAG: hypothetical protein QOG30_1052 [Acidimicrobiaceae bacterium]
MAAAFTYIDGGGKRAGGIGTKTTVLTPFNGNAGRSLSNATIGGTARSVQISGVVGLSSLSIDMGTDRWSVRSDGDPIEGTGIVTVQGEGIIVATFRTVIALGSATFESRDGHIGLADGVTVNGTIVHGENVELNLTPGSRPWLDPPPSMEFRAAGEFSWTGSGDIGIADQHLSGQYLGAMGSLTVTLTRTADAIQLAASGPTEQVFVDGQPALNTSATIERLRTDITAHAGDSNDSTYVTWAPGDTGSFGMCILRVVPRSGHAEWVNVGLQHMPPMFGGEQHAPIGGDTSGMGDHGRFFGGPDAIDSFIGVGDADRRDLSLNVPVGTPPGVYPIEIAIEGNFESVVFSMTVTVAG